MPSLPSLPILQTTIDPTPATLVRLFHQTELQWCRQTSEEQVLDIGTALFNPQFDRVWDANCVIGASLPPGIEAGAAVLGAERFFREKGARLWKWIMNPSLQTENLETHLRAAGYRMESFDILRLGRRPTLSEVPGLRIIPARAGFKHTRQLADEAARRWHEPQVAEAEMLRLDDPHLDALIALKEGVPVASVAVLAVGEIGRIESVFVTDSERRKGIGRTMMSRAMEICARSLFKHVMLSHDPANVAARSLYRSLGFEKIGTIKAYSAGNP